MTNFLHIALAQAGGQPAGPSTVFWIILAVMLVFVLIFFAVLANFINLWVQAMLSGAPVPMLELVGMRLRKVDPRVIVQSRIRASQAGLGISTSQLESHYLAGGHVPAAVTAMMIASKGGVDLSWDAVCAADLAGRDIAQEVRALVQLKTAAGGSTRVDEAGTGNE
jgi:uncharacterized protein YqfA (UPF0365 family)